jgi:outer membrane protein W
MEYYSLTKKNTYSSKKIRGIAIPIGIDYIFHKKPLIILYFLSFFLKEKMKMKMKTKEEKRNKPL